MVLLGLWQLRRLDDKRVYRDLVVGRQEQSVAPVEALLPVEATARAVDGVLHRAVTTRGTYDDEATVVVDSRSLNGASGGWVLTPLRLRDGRAVVVNRGFLGFDRDGRITPPSAPDGAVTVEGLLQPTQERGRFGPTDPATGQLTVMARVDLDRLAAQVPYDLAPAYVQRVTSEPDEPAVAGGAPALVPLGRPRPEEGPHLAYAVQWFIFSAIAAGGYLLLLRKLALERGRSTLGATSPDHEQAEVLDPAP